jgi:hypothetical protein
MTFDVPRNETACIAVVGAKRHGWAEPDPKSPNSHYGSEVAYDQIPHDKE